LYPKAWVTSTQGWAGGLARRPRGFGGYLTDVKRSASKYFWFVLPAICHIKTQGLDWKLENQPRP